MTTRPFDTVFKLHTLNYSMVPCGPTKVSLVQWKPYQDNPADEAQLKAWADELSPPLWALLTSDWFAVIDADTKEARERLTKALGPPHVETPRGGAHWYIDTKGHPLKTVAGLLPGVDIRGVGGYVIIVGGKYRINRLPTLDALIPFDKLPKDIKNALNGRKPAGSTITKDKPIPDGKRNAVLTRIGGAIRRQGGDWDSIYAAICAVKCEHDLPDEEKRAIATSLCRYEPQPDGEAGHFNLTDYGNAERLVKQYGEIIRFSPERNLWMIWNGKYWAWDRGDIEIVKLAKKTVRSIYHEAGNEPDDKIRASIATHAKDTEKQWRLDSMIKSAQSEPGIAIMLAEVDSDQWLLNVGNGTIDLRTGTLKSHDAADLITKIMPLAYNPDAECPLWNKFLNDTTDGNKDLIDYLQLIYGVCLTGDMTDQIFFYIYGLGQNGKSTFTTMLLDLTGDYGMRVDSEMFMMADKGKGGATEAIANIRGKRVLVSSEVSADRHLNTGLLKDLSGGGESIRARRLYEHEVEFKPICKIVMYGNHKPTIKEATMALWRRLKLIPFDHTVLDNDRDYYLADKLKMELPGILAWAVRGCLNWKAVRFLDEPEAVTNATRAYRADEDLIADFLSDMCELGQALAVDQAKMKKTYLKWCEDNGIKPLGPKKFGERLIEKNCQKTVIKNVRSWAGVAIK